jgi:hypothetical protein
VAPSGTLVHTRRSPTVPVRHPGMSAASQPEASGASGMTRTPEAPSVAGRHAGWSRTWGTLQAQSPTHRARVSTGPGGSSRATSAALTGMIR